MEMADSDQIAELQRCDDSLSGGEQHRCGGHLETVLCGGSDQMQPASLTLYARNIERTTR